MSSTYSEGTPQPPPPSEPTGTPVPPALFERQPRKRWSRLWVALGSILTLAVGAGIIAGFVVDLPYYALEPGSVYDTIDRVEAPADLETEPQGEIGFVTVAQTANISPWEWLDAKLDKNTRIRHEDEVRGDQTADELREADLRRMQVSKSDAVVVALQRLGYDLTITPTGIEVAQVFDCTAADGTLNTGDLIVGVNGIDTRSGEQLIDRLSGMSVGDSVDLLVERIDPNNPTQSLNTDEVPLTLGSADAECLSDDIRAEEPRAFIGISTLTMYDEDFPIEVNLRTGRVSSSGATLESNGLTAFETILDSEAVLIQSDRVLSPDKADLLKKLLSRIDGVIKSAETKYILLNAPKDKVEAISALLPGSDAPTIMPLSGSTELVALQAVCTETIFWETLEDLKALGARAILVLPIEKMMS